MAASESDRFVPACRVSLDGQALSSPVRAALTRADVDLDADLFGTCTLTFNDPKLELINGKLFGSGAAVKVELGYSSSLLQVFQGEVVALEPLFLRDKPPSLRVVCFERLHRLGLSQMTRSFNDVDDSQIAQKIAQEHGLSAEAPSGTKEHALQGNVSDASFLRRLAAAQGNTVRVEDKKLIIGPPPEGAEITVGPSQSLSKARIVIDARGQVEEVSVHGWDPKTKQEIVGKAKGEGEIGEGARAHGNSATLSVSGSEKIAPDVATAEKMAKARMRKLSEGFVTATLDLRGDARLLVGAKISLEKLGGQVDGTYRVDKAVHRWSRHGYATNCTVVRISKKTAAAAAQEKAAAAALASQPAAVTPKEKPPPDEMKATVSGAAEPFVVDVSIEGFAEPSQMDASIGGSAEPAQVDASASAEPDTHHMDAEVMPA
ncbi:MAG TPA: contractile injection system protein, VgrG/Pvc8 family [Myxococcales bacterium]|nr:contractile injection system protein, VgrG/Pvc8 family [Myxococcales bacterium]